MGDKLLVRYEATYAEDVAKEAKEIAEKSIERKIFSSVKNLLMQGVGVEIIASSMDVSIDDVKKIQLNEIPVS